MTATVKSLVIVLVVAVFSQVAWQACATFYDPLEEDSVDSDRMRSAQEAFRETQKRMDAAAGTAYFLDWDAGGIAFNGIPKWNDSVRSATSEKIPRGARHVIAVLSAVAILTALLRRGVSRELAVIFAAIGAGFVVQQAWGSAGLRFVVPHYVGLMGMASWFATSERPGGLIKMSLAANAALLISGISKLSPVLVVRYPFFLGLGLEVALSTATLAAVFYSTRLILGRVDPAATPHHPPSPVT